MPLKLIPPRPGKTPNYYIRGTHLGVDVDETTRTPVESLAKQFLAKKKREIQCRELAPVEKSAAKEQTFSEAALAYMEAGGDGQYLAKIDKQTGDFRGGLIPLIGDKFLSEITQAVIDTAATSLYPGTSAATRNRQVHTPISAVLKYAGHDFKIKRPKGWRGKKRTDWLRPEQAFRLFEAASANDREFGAFLVFLCYTGCRLNDALRLTCDRVALSEGFAYIEQTKNGDPRGVHLPPIVVTELGNHPRGMDRGKEKVFRFRKCGRLYTFLSRAKEAAGPDLIEATFHTLCHTWATWMRRYAGLDTRGLVGTGRWRDEKSAARYEHVVASEESRKADLLPTPKRKRNKVHGNSTDSGAEFRRRSPVRAGKAK